MKKIAALFATLAAAAGLMMASPAQAAPAEGKEYQVLKAAQPVTAGKIEVTEFFWYGCPHCYDFEPEIEGWVKKQGKDVVFKRVPVAFRDDLLPHTRIYYALESMGKLEAMHGKVFSAIHAERKRLLDPNEIADLMAKNGIDRKAFLEAYNSFSVSTNTTRANKIADAYKIDGVPTIVIQGKYVTSPSIAGSKGAALQTMDYLVTQVRDKKL
ncbi:thiol:disulfide interchange protein DsbA/DsbL [Cupriavidus gilardii]|uniref:Thiol:disulfide interchange protein n=2 Tax=Pseudomonadota TaxID=1224 RepID=A0A6N1BGI2_9BURK|nr:MULTISPECIES: thiol:disulfide interchange protein DsbA/DsbL [Cupriavidus]ALD89332.1 thiol:disulfide interchange protein DsbA [Cupriavidus gilardii CR3]QQE07011.1 thiol:disulfide interchange protein DsbA/DsbL [Cupriavidus sp. ISTL7]KAB0596635.1 thiol:disulfide interchange protein DsbA/DsbL [Cupriavidus gilardii]MCD9121959.1 thiol:disulfide interchange protein DsbA/DsbL [Cupriavidus sp. UGS-1]MCT9013721.1 thiol:disulfide interchange protein DsbA/DsbL [Cupriavidus gilardii]